MESDCRDKIAMVKPQAATQTPLNDMYLVQFLPDAPQAASLSHDMRNRLHPCHTRLGGSRADSIQCPLTVPNSSRIDNSNN